MILCWLVTDQANTEFDFESYGKTGFTHRRLSSLSFLLVISCFHPTPTTSGSTSWLSSPVNPLVIIGKYSLIMDFCTSNFPRAAAGRSMGGALSTDALLLGCHGTQTKVARNKLRCSHANKYELYVNNVDNEFHPTPSRRKKGIARSKRTCEKQSPLWAMWFCRPTQTTLDQSSTQALRDWEWTSLLAQSTKFWHDLCHHDANEECIQWQITERWLQTPVGIQV